MFRFSPRTTADVVAGFSRMVSDLEAVANQHGDLARDAEAKAAELHRQAQEHEGKAQGHYDERVRAAQVMAKVRALIE